jgi:hypothetical protein
MKKKKKSNNIFYNIDFKVEDTRMNHIMKLAHNLLQYFCYDNPTNQAKLYELYFNDYQQLSEVEFSQIFDHKIYYFYIRNKKLKHVVIYF